jgi:hypothetical protein
MGHDAGLFAGLNVLDLVVTPIGNGIDLINAKDLLGCLCGLRQKTDIQNLIAHRLLDDQLVLGIDRDLNVVADRDPRVRCHGPAIGIGQ